MPRQTEIKVRRPDDRWLMVQLTCDGRKPTIYHRASPVRQKKKKRRKKKKKKREQMNRRGIRRTDAEETLLRELSAYDRSGCSICLDGKPCLPWQAASACFREHTEYMRDFVSNDNSMITQINFVRIREM